MSLRAKGLTLLAALWASACAARGHIATPAEVALLKESTGLSASGQITLKGPGGRFGTKVVLGVARPDSLRIEIPDGGGLRFLLVCRNGTLRADLPREGVLFEGQANREVMHALFGIDLDPEALVGAILGSSPDGFSVRWRFEGSMPTQVTIEGSDATQLSLRLDDPEMAAPPARAFESGPIRGRRVSLDEMSDRLGLRR